MQQMPTYRAIEQWTLLALRNLGGSGHIKEIDDMVKQMIQLPDEIVDQIQSGDSRTVLEYRVAWARSKLRSAGLLENSDSKVCTLTPNGIAESNGLGVQVSDAVEEFHSVDATETDAPIDGDFDGEGWKESLLDRIMSLSPGAFERLCQRLLRESGFVQVRVTGRSGDGGIDGQGILQMARLVSFPVLFQCKRWQNTVGAGVVRDFRGAMYGRADRGLIITTSTFTAEARREAVRDGAPPIDLIDGISLADNLRDLNLGVKEIVVVDEAWFDELQSWAVDDPAPDAVFGAA